MRQVMEVRRTETRFWYRSNRVSRKGGRTSEFQAAMRAALMSTTTTWMSGHLKAIMAIVGPARVHGAFCDELNVIGVQPAM